MKVLILCISVVIWEAVLIWSLVRDWQKLGER